MAPSELFKDLKFFIVQRVPSRLSLVQTVKDHGGTIVPLEKQADILVADHARKDVPAGDFVSWLFITESVKHGRLENLDDRRIHRPSKGPGPAASGTAKGTRVQFSSEDDKLLRLWVARPASKEAGTSGNIIFKELAERNPRHTWQSWRDRWVKKLAPSADIEESPQETRGAQRISPPATGEAPEPKREKFAAKGTRIAFTKDDDDHLRTWMLRPENEGVGMSGTKIFKELAEDNPRHTWQSWRERWVKRVSHSVGEEPAETTPPPSTNQQNDSEQVQKKGTKKTPAPRSPARTTPAKSPSPRVTRSEPRPTPSTPGARRVAATPDLRSGPSGSEQSDTEFPPVRTEPTAQRESAQPSSSNPQARTQFYEHFQAYRTAIDKPLVTSVTITRRPVDLWDLWSAVTSQTVDHDVRDWEDVAKELDFDWVSNPTVTHQLRKAFDLHLLKFEVLRREYLEDQDSDDSDADDVSATAEQAQAAPSPPPPPVFRSSPPVAGAKRTWDQTFERGFQSSISFQSPSRKRREYDRGEVVPESPQEDTPRTPPTASSPSKQRASSVSRPGAPREPSPQKAIPSKPVEPETQDFGVIYEREERTPSPSPSQQLQQEFLSMSSRTLPLERPSSEPSSPTPRMQAGRPRSTNTALSSSAASGARNTPQPGSAPKAAFNFEEEIDRLVSLGIDAYDVIKAYKCTNMDKHLTGMVLEAFCKHEAIPQHTGVWTTTDDAALRYIDERIMAQAPEDLVDGERVRRVRMMKQRAKLVEKHGEEALSRRRLFLEDWAIPQGYEALSKAVDGVK